MNLISGFAYYGYFPRPTGAVGDAKAVNRKFLKAQIWAWRPAILTEGFNGFPETLQENIVIVI